MTCALLSKPSPGYRHMIDDCPFLLFLNLNIYLVLHDTETVGRSVVRSFGRSDG